MHAAEVSTRDFIDGQLKRNTDCFAAIHSCLKGEQWSECVKVAYEGTDMNTHDFGVTLIIEAATGTKLTSVVRDILRLISLCDNAADWLSVGQESDHSRAGQGQTLIEIYKEP
jgi:hypothetical protein